MDISLPHFKYCARGGSNKNYGFIECNGNFVHEINNLDEFYRVFGYTADIAKAGILPDEFIWEEYIKNKPAAYANCMQIHIIEYLVKQSDTFRKMFGEQCENWMAAHSEAATANGLLCITCRMNKFCTRNEAICNVNFGNKQIERDNWIDAHYEAISSSGRSNKSSSNVSWKL